MSIATASRLLSCSLPRCSQFIALRHFSEDQNQFERPKMYHLKHVQARVEYCTTIMFKEKLDFTFYRKDVLLEDDIFGTKKQGLHQLMNHFGMITVCSQLFIPAIEFEPLNLLPMLDDGTVRLRWRVKYLTWIQIFNPKNFNKEIRKRNMHWFDGYSVFHVDGNGEVFKLKIQKTMPDESFLDNSKKLAQRIVGIQSNTANATSTDNNQV